MKQGWSKLGEFVKYSMEIPISLPISQEYPMSNINLGIDLTFKAALSQKQR